MASSETHPHIDMPSESDLERVISESQPAQRELYLGAHRLVLEAVPEVHFSVDSVDAAIGYGAHQFGYDGWGMAAVTPYKGWVSVGFLRGALLDDPEQLLEGSGTLVRHVKLKNASDFADKRAALGRLLEQAAKITVDPASR